MVELYIHDFTIDGSKKSVNDVMSRLTFISKFRSDYKVNVGKLRLDKNGIVTDLWRCLVSGEKRGGTAEFIESTIQDALDMIDHCVKMGEQYTKIINLLIFCLEEAKTGIRELCLNKSYASDCMFVSRLETCVRLLNVKLEHLEPYKKS